MPKPLNDASYLKDQLSSSCHALHEQLQSMLTPDADIISAVHQSRKLGKLLRGGCMLTTIHTVTNPQLQVLGRTLSHHRDSIIRQKTWSSLAWDEDRVAADSISQTLATDAKYGQCSPSVATLQWCQLRLLVVKTAIDALPIDTMQAAIHDGKNHLAQMVLARSHPHQLLKRDGYHHARKAIKALLGAIDCLADDHSDIKHSYKPIADDLGDENDLSTLRQWLSSHGYTPRIIPSLWQIIHEKQAVLQARSIDHLQTLPSETLLKSFITSVS